MDANDERLVTVAEAPSRIIAEMWQELLRLEGIPTVVRSSDAVAYLGALAPCSLLATAQHAGQARELLASRSDEAE